MARPHLSPRLLQSLSPENVERLQALGRRIGFVKGRVVFTEGQPAIEAFLLLEGRLAMTVGTGEDACTVGDVWPGEFAGERALLGGAGVHHVTVTAAANSRGIMLDRESLTLLGDSTAMVAIQGHLVRTLLRRLQGADLAVRKAWQEVRAADARAAGGGETEAQEAKPLVDTLRAIFSKLLGGAQ